jgi:hypothetical protein
MNSNKKKLLKDIENRKKPVESEMKNKTAPNESRVSLEQVELRIRRITDELNNTVVFLCRNMAQLTEENQRLKSGMNKSDNGSKK